MGRSHHRRAEQKSYTQALTFQHARDAELSVSGYGRLLATAARGVKEVSSEMRRGINPLLDGNDAEHGRHHAIEKDALDRPDAGGPIRRSGIPRGK